MSGVNPGNKITSGAAIRQETTRQNRIEQGSLRFQQMLEQEISANQSVKLSAHAQQRLQQRNITLDENDMAALKRGMDQAAGKGAQESLLLYKDLAFVASIRNRTVITAVGQNDTKENVFTKIDSAVIIND